MTTKTKTERKTRTRSLSNATSNLQSRVSRPRRSKQSKLNLDQISISRALKVSSTRDDSIDSDRVVVNADVAEPCSSINCDEQISISRFSSSQDMVWAKAYSNTWLPGCVRREYDGKVLVSFFGCKRSVWVCESEVRSFERDFEQMVGKEVGKRLDSSAIDCALAEFGRRLTLELSCSCQDSLEDGEDRDELERRGEIDANEVFQPVEALGFARKMAVLQSFDEIDSIRVFRVAAQVNAFRRFAFIKRDWIYEETMRLSEANDDSVEEMMSTCSEDEITCSVTQGVEFENEEEQEDAVVDGDNDDDKDEELGGEEENEEDDDKECVDVDGDNDDDKDEELGGEEENEENDDKEWVEQDKSFIGTEDMCFEDVQDERTPVVSNDGEFEDEGEQEFDVDDENGDGECVEKVKSIEQESVVGKSQIAVQGMFNPVEVLTFVQRMAVSAWMDDADTLGVIRAAACVKKFRRHTFIRHDWIYHETMRLSDSTNESDGNMDGTSSVHDQTQKVNFSDDGEYSHNQFVKPVQSALTICKKTVEDPAHDILKHLYCLAIDPFLGSKLDGARNSNDVFQKILRYRELLYQKVTVFPQPIEFTSCYDCVAETSEVHNFLKASPTTNHSNFSVNVPVIESIVVANDNRTQNSLFLSDSWGQHSKKTRDEVKYCDRRSNVKDVIEPAHKDLGLARGSNNCNGEFESDKVQKIRDMKVSSSSGDVEGRDIVDLQRGILVCNQKTADMMVYKMNNTRQNVDVNTCRSTSNVQGRDMVNLQRDIPAWDSEYQSSQRQEPEDRKICTSNKRQKNMDAVVRCDSSNVEGGNIVGLQRDIPECNGEYKSNKRQKTEDINVCRTSKVKSENVINNERDTPYNCVNKRQKTDGVKGNDNICSSHFESNKCQKISASDSVLNFQGRSTKALPGGISASAINDSDESKTSSHVLKDHPKSKHWNKPCTNGRNVDLKVDCKSNGMPSTLPGETKSQEIGGTLCEDRTGFPACQRPSSSHLSHKSIDLHRSSGCDADIINRELNARIVSGGCPEVTKSQHTGDVSVKYQQPKTLLPLTMLYSSPLSAASPVSSGSQYKSSKAPTHSDNPTTLHMKFPKDFKLPSKEELVNKFCPFGPIDHLKTKIFFYTGSAQIVFLHYLDAESACHYVKRKNIFLGGANVRFWIDQHEHSRRGTNKTSAPVSLLPAGSLIPNVKPCLKISKGIYSERKHLHVKFPSCHQDFPSDTVEAKHFTCSELPKFGNEVEPNISQQMSVLLEKCDQTVKELKNTLGLQSFYSLFTQIPNLVRDRDV